MGLELKIGENLEAGCTNEVRTAQPNIAARGKAIR